MKHRTQMKVRFGDTDMLGHVNNAAYFTYMEEARIRFLEDEVELEGMPLVLASAKVDYRAQTFYHQTLEIESWIIRLGNSSFEVACKMYDIESRQLVFEGTAVIVHFDFAQQKSARIPDKIREKLQAYYHAEEPVKA